MSQSVVETLISRQLHQYNRLKELLRDDSQVESVPRAPVITISRMDGCCAGDLARGLAERLEVQSWGRELVDQIARDKGLRRSVVEKLDEGLVSNVDAWVRGVLQHQLFMRNDYAEALIRTIKTLAETGGAVIVGRGAGFILGERADLRLRLVASNTHRLTVLAREHGFDEDEACDHIERTDAARAEFVHKYFGKDVDDPRHYDLVVNTDRVVIDDLVETCVRLVE